MKQRKTWVIHASVIIATACNAAAAWSNPIMDGADPDVLIDQAHGRYWIYPTNELHETEFYAYHSKDLQHWSKTGPALSIKDISWINSDKAPSHALWAPGIYQEGENYFLYYAVGPQNPTPSRIGVATAKTPEGPFVDSGSPLVTGDAKFEAIDPMVFNDQNTGKVYLYCGGSAAPEMRVYELTQDRVHVLTRVSVETPQGFTEAPFMHKRGDKFYLSYSQGKWSDDTYCVAYSTSQSPLGPWTYRGKILETDSHHAGPGHHAIFQTSGGGKWFIAYHRWNKAKLEKKMPPGRSVSIEELEYDKDGLIKPIKMTDDGPPPLVFPEEPVTTSTVNSGNDGRLVASASIGSEIAICSHAPMVTASEGMAATDPAD